ncbi:MAG: hypothetical protein PF542_05075 [Nanoarchaeota archaeon]|jgi:hypothetical protein|nr:hypothetical protein [Nanoarchaeota archaeon]
MDLTNKFLIEAEKYPEFDEALEIVNNNSNGNVWLIGGFIYRNIVASLYGIEKPIIDLDFIVEDPIDKFDLPKNWIVSKNRFGNPKLINEIENKSIDLVPLDNIYSMLYNNLEPTIGNYLKGVPLTIQSMVYDVKNKQIIGDIGIKSIKNKLVEVNDLHFGQYAASKKGKSLSQYIIGMAKTLNFNYKLPDKI